MDADFVRDRITQLRLQKGASEYKVSYDLGHSRGYINNISSGKTLPSMGEFLAICDYFGITPTEFFDTQVKNPKLAERTVKVIQKLDDEDLELVLRMAERLLKK